MSNTYAAGDEMTLQAIARDAASTEPAQPHLDHYPRHYSPPPVAQGWQCPVCKTVYAPSVTMCRCDIEDDSIDEIFPHDAVMTGKPHSVTPVRIRVTDQEAAE